MITLILTLICIYLVAEFWALWHIAEAVQQLQEFEKDRQSAVSFHKEKKRLKERPRSCCLRIFNR